ncbi:hypothetical protein PUND_a1862 [Pseudoalteromonas undina]|nr:hypothetical protein PUND_a1862 [Pseudoalteromonas undina]
MTFLAFILNNIIIIKFFMLIYRDKSFYFSIECGLFGLSTHSVANH